MNDADRIEFEKTLKEAILSAIPLHYVDRERVADERVRQYSSILLRQAAGESDGPSHASFKIIQLEGQVRDAQMVASRAHAFLRDLAVYLEEGVRDGVELADDIHEALGDERPNGTKPEGEEEED